MITIIRNIRKIVGYRINENDVPYVSGVEMKNPNILENAYIIIKNDKIHACGLMSSLDQQLLNAPDTEVIDATGRMVLPAWCDSHTHLVYPASREIEYVDKIKGLSYEEIAKRGGGILNSARMLKETSEEQLFEDASKRLDLISHWGTGAVEIKSGYGLDTEGEIKMLRVIQRLKEKSKLSIKSTFLGAHAIPPKYKGDQKAYVDLIIDEMLPRIGEEDLADYVDVFCDRGFFTVESTDRILEASAKYGLVPKIHANELDYSGGIQVGVKHQALSVDHLEFTGDAEIEALLDSGTMPTLLPSAAFFLGMIDPPARKMIDSGLPLALASDFNPGSAPSGNMQFVISLACIKLRLLPEEAINAATINSAYAMGVDQHLGSITPEKTANLIITKPMSNLEYLPYAFSENKVETTIINGEII